LIFLLDATFPPQLGRALQELDQEGCYFRHATSEFGEGAKDEVIFAGIQERDWFLITLDAKMSKRPAQRQAIIDARLGVFVFTGSSLAQRSFREIASFVLGVADSILDLARTTKRPFIWGISDRRVFGRLDQAK
jgi:predicted nuclease of predicted toxin-antitoxin system